MKQLSTRNIAIISLIAIAILALGVFVIEKNKEVSLPMPIPENQEDTPMSSEEFSKYNKVLPEAKITGVKDLEGEYKKVTINNGEITFSFEVPDTWLVETRNSGEVEMNEEELREFLGTKWNGDIKAGEQCWQANVYDVQVGDFVMKEQCGYPFGNYWDFTWNILKEMSYDEMKEYFNKIRDEFSPGFPNASISSGNVISYLDGNGYQIDIYVLHESKDAQYLSGVNYCYDTSCLQQKYETYRTNTMEKVDRDEEGSPVIDKDRPWGFGGYLKIDDRVVRIWKEAYVEGDFEDNFQHILNTLSFQ